MTTTTNSFDNRGDVETQVGVNNGIIHKTSIYNNNVGEPPEKKFANALTYLRGGQPRMAEQLLEQVRQAGLTSIRFHYYYLLSILSDRTLNELTPHEFRKIVFALQSAKSMPEDNEPGGYRDALAVIERLIAYIEQQDRAADPTGAQIEAVSQSFQGLAAPRQEEIARHLDMILDGAVQDSLDAAIAALAQQQRMEDRRANRAWLYFQPEPAPPLLAEPAKPGVDLPKWAMFVLGGLAAVWGLVLVVGFMTGPETVAPGVTMWFSLLLVLGGVFLFVWFRIQAKVMDRRRAVREARWQGVHEPAPREVPAWKIQEFQWYVDLYVATQRPRKRNVRQHVNNVDAEPEKDWDRDTAGLRISLIDWLVRIYGATRTEPSGLEWLVRFHVARMKDQWQAGQLLDFRKELRTPWYAKVLPPVGAVVAVLCTLALIGMGMPGPAVLLGIGLGVGAVGAAEVLSTFRLRAALRAEYAAQLRDEEDNYRGWL